MSIKKGDIRLNHYEVMFILHPEEEKIATIKDEVKKIVAEHKGQVTFEHDYGMKDLKYLIKKQVKGYYHLIEMDMDGTEIKPFVRSVQLTEPILKHLIVRK